MTERDFVFIKHIFDVIRNIETSLKGIDKEKFVSDIDLKDANIRRLEIIGEAVKNLSKEFREKNNKIEWRKIAGFRDVIIHRYFEVDLDIVWQILEKEVPDLKKKLKGTF